MKKIFTIFLMISVFPSFAQENLDNVWLFGQFGGTANPLFKGSIVDFTTGEPVSVTHTVTFEMDMANTSICDESGNLLFYTNGRYIGNAEHEIMENGGELNNEYSIGSDQYLILRQGIITIPKPGNPGHYYLFHAGMIPIYPDGSLDVASYPLFSSTVDFNDTNFPLGKVVDKNSIIVEDTLNLGKLTMTRHANGRDWWLITSQWNTNRYYRFLINPNGIENIGIQEVGTQAYEGGGQAVFSPDGSMYAHVSLNTFQNSYVNLYNFDRCTGELSNHRQYEYTDGASAVGLGFSPNSRYLYFNNSIKIFQYDLFADDVWATEQLVAEYDGYEEEVLNDASGATFHIPTTFFLQQLGPDGKIYLNATNSVSSLHVIDQPNEAGAACNVIQRGLDLPALNRFSLPNFPNYRLGRLEGSPCDTLDFTSTAGVPASEAAVRVYPNPNEGYFTVAKSSHRLAVFRLYSTTGQSVHEQPCPGRETVITAADLPKGVYFYHLSDEEGILKSGKLIVN